MSDLYQQLNTNREVPPRTQDGFRNDREKDSQLEKISNRGADKNDNGQTPEEEKTIVSSHLSDSVANSDAPDYLVETSKSKLLTLEVSLRQKLEQHLFDNPDISWDTFIESALILCFKNQSQTQRATKLAAERLSDRKRSAVYKRTQTMSKKFI